MDGKLKLFVVGCASGNPDNWSGGFGIVAANDIEEARGMTDLLSVAEIDIDRPMVILSPQPIADTL